MLKVNQFTGFGVGQVLPDLEISFLQTTGTDTNGTSASFASYNLGVAASDRRIFILAVWQGIANTLVSVTIGGVTATIHVTTTIGQLNIGLVSAIVPTGTSGTVVVTVTSSSGRFHIGGWHVTGLKDSTPTATDTSAGAGTSDTLVVNAPARSIVIAGAAKGTASPGDITISNVTEDFDTIQEIVQRQVGGHASVASADASYSMAVAWAFATDDEVALALSWK